ncbi:tripartite tricarboxylate transporter substrate binding protein [Alcaligenaceae bacterium]|nr:tripartite tricarboxylate transporter substrate binding protein [Alcaligenaceae bacterium]
MRQVKRAARNLIRCAVAGAIMTFAWSSHATDFPSRPITLVVPYPAGSATDNIARPLAQALQNNLGQAVVILNRAGGQGTIGAQHAARSEPDGYTLLLASSSMFAGNALFKNLPYDPIKSFEPISGIASTSMMFMVKSDSPYKSIKDLIAAVKAKGEPVNIGIGAGSAQVVLAMLTEETHGNITPINYRGTPQALTDLTGGQIPVAIVDIGNGVVQMNSGRLRALAISATKRSNAAPDVPVLSESLPGASLETIIAVVGPAGIPQPIVERLNKAFLEVLDTPEVKKGFAAATTEVMPVPTSGLVQLLKTDVPRWHDLIKAAGIVPQ